MACVDIIHTDGLVLGSSNKLDDVSGTSIQDYCSEGGFKRGDGEFNSSQPLTCHVEESAAKLEPT